MLLGPVLKLHCGDGHARPTLPKVFKFSVIKLHSIQPAEIALKPFISYETEYKAVGLGNREIGQAYGKGDGRQSRMMKFLFKLDGSCRRAQLRRLFSCVNRKAIVGCFKDFAIVLNLFWACAGLRQYDIQWLQLIEYHA